LCIEVQTWQQHEAFTLFDRDQNGDITKLEMREAVQRIYRERKALISSLKVRVIKILVIVLAKWL